MSSLFRDERSTSQSKEGKQLHDILTRSIFWFNMLLGATRQRPPFLSIKRDELPGPLHSSSSILSIIAMDTKLPTERPRYESMVIEGVLL